MIRKFIVLLICVLINIIYSYGQDVETNKIVENTPAVTTQVGDGYGVVKIQLYYECLCPDCRNFDRTAFKPTVLELEPYLDIHLYPYGKAKTIDNGDGKYEFTCQHGPAECYGNKLHACAIDILHNITAAVLYNSCLMEYSQAGKGSDDIAANVCGRSMPKESESIKECAKGTKGMELLKFYGEESKKPGFTSVPHVLINGVQGRDDHFKEDVCKAFSKPPPPCKQ